MVEEEQGGRRSKRGGDPQGLAHAGYCSVAPAIHGILTNGARNRRVRHSRIIMYAVVETGGKQYRVREGDVVRVETLPGEVGSEVELGRVLAVETSEGLTVGEAARGAKVTGTIESQGRGEKTLVFKFKRKKQYKRTIGHRQNFTAVKVGAIAL
jgi:large subunit ribosomal protein L21